MGIRSFLFGDSNDSDVEYTVGDDGTDYDIQDGDMVDLGNGEVYYDEDDEDPDVYDDSTTAVVNEDGFFDW